MSVKPPSLPLTGGCPCGAIRYEITSFPLCSTPAIAPIARATSGSAFALNMPVKTKDFRILQGEPKGWRRLSPSGADVTSWFCGDCGGRIYGERVGRPQSINLRAGTLDDTKWLVPVAHMYMRSAQPWVLPAADAECHEIAPNDFQAAAKLARDVAGVLPAKIVAFFQSRARAFRAFTVDQSS